MKEILTAQEIAEQKEQFISMLMATGRPGIDKLVDYLENQTDFFTAPSSAKYHNNFEGGLVAHCLNVYDNFTNLLSMKNIEMDESSIVIVSLMHDLCKANFYTKEEKNRKVNGKWETYDAWGYIKNPSVPLPHASRSIRMLRSFIQIKFLEELIIYYHMGPYGGEDYEYKNLLQQVNTQYPETLLFYIADLMASYMDEKTVE